MKEFIGTGCFDGRDSVHVWHAWDHHTVWVEVQRPNEIASVRLDAHTVRNLRDHLTSILEGALYPSESYGIGKH